MQEETKEYNNEHKGGFYIALSICLAVVMISAYVAYTNLNKVQLPDSDDVMSNQTSEESSSNTELEMRACEEHPKHEVCVSPNVPRGNPNNDGKAKQVSLSENSNSAVSPTREGITKGFCDSKPVYSKTLNDWRTHTGIDFKAKEGGNVYSISDGKVLDVYSDQNLGTTISIEHLPGTVTYYCGVDPKVSKNENIKKNQEIGVIGKVPMETKEESHLHLSVKKDGKLVDPMSVFNFS